ncbi:type III-B CRISPR-associated protein Cas10/Cmr2 [Saccharolobus islandicus]|uniref:type III-B CRISPR-associated protein Cas10/Cmr2 n=1 Tax=Saccharolobus islandicus TaxID=43080 RepID=UPI000372FF6A|nr:type III-B CRISPR-associated protein Cas10/Cmr2 [Sulfolobus islandicus]
MSTGGNNISINVFIIQKIKALLHDPPNKSAIISWNILSRSLGHDKRLRRKHETEAKNLAKAIFDEKLGNGKIRDSDVSKADNLASSIDRYLGSIVYRHSSIFPEMDIKLKNILLPSLTKENYDLSHFPIFSNKYNRNIPLNPELKKPYVYNLKKYYNAITYEILAYQTFYLVYELSWINNNLLIGPAETRNPTHTIFDHLYATAAMMNWILTFKGRGGNKRKGYLLGIDTIGVADFISKGRKTRDLWISSYLVSALLWYVITWFIEEYGPDVILFPSLRFNQFYAFYLLEKLIKEGVSEDVIDEIKELITKYIFNGDDLFENLKIPPYPIIPGRITLILPGLIREDEKCKKVQDDNCFISKVKERYNEGWRKLIEGLKRYSELKREDGFWNLVCRVLKLTEDFFQTTPLNIRVKQVSVTKDEIFDNNKLRSDSWKIYDNKYRQLVSEFKRSKLVKVTPESRLKLFELTKFDKLPQIGEKSKRGYEFCTSCGVLPAVVIMPKEDDFEKKLFELGIARDEKDVRSIKNMVSPGERLCPWCLVKRALGAEPRLMRILLLGDLYSVEEIVNEIVSKDVKIEIPSTSDIASIKTFEEMIEKKNEICEDLKEEEVCKTPNDSSFSMWQWFNKNYYNGINLTIDPEAYWFSEKRRKYYFSLFRRHRITFPSPYYALVRADSDYLGDLLEGKLTPYLAGIIDSGDYANISEKKEVSKLLEEYLVNAGSGPIVDYVKTVLECIRGNLKICSCAVKIYSNEVAKVMFRANVEEEVKNSLEYFETILNEGRIIVTPAWHVSISSALNRGLLVELELINKHKGFVIYAGGDDLLAMLPVDEVLDFIKESRRVFAGFGTEKLGNICLENGFVRINSAYYPSLPIVGRSYSVIIAHYADPLFFVINDSYNLLEEGKEMIRYRVMYNGEYKDAKKDVAIFRYQGLTSVIPLSLKRPIVNSVSDFNEIASTIDVILELKKRIDEGRISVSLLYDYEGYKHLIVASDEKYLTEFLVKDWIKRNSLRKRVEFTIDEKLYGVRLTIENYPIKIPNDLISNVVYTLRIIYGGEK